MLDTPPFPSSTTLSLPAHSSWMAGQACDWMGASLAGALRGELRHVSASHRQKRTKADDGCGCKQNRKIDSHHLERAASNARETFLGLQENLLC
eukprot:762815-Hanusia_phi.AAC.2